MLNKDTLNVLKALQQISTTVVMTYPIVGFKNKSDSMFAYFDVSHFAEEEFNDFGIYNTTELLSVIGSVGSRDSTEITIDQGVLTIVGDAGTLRYNTANIGLIEDQKASVKFLEKVKEGTAFLTFDIESTQIESLKKVSSVLKDLSDLNIETNGNTVELKASNKENSSNAFTVTARCEKIEDVKLSIDMSHNFKSLPNGNYKVKITKNARGVWLTIFESKDVEGMYIIVGTQNQ